MRASDKPAGRPLEGHEDRTGTTVHGRASVVVGLVSAGAGTPAILTYLGFLSASPGDAPRFVIGFVGGVFALAGLAFVLHGLVGMRRESRVALGRLQSPREPWRWDHPWNERGARDDSPRRLGLWAWRIVLLAAFGVPFNWLVFFSGDLPWWVLIGFGLGTGILDLMVLYVLYRFSRSATRLLRHGPSGLRYARFPFFLGESLDVSFHPTGRLEGLCEFTATLRCVEDRYEERGTGEDQQTIIVGYGLHEQTKAVGVQTGGVSRTLGVNLSFLLPDPALAPSTSLGERPSTYWELQIKAPDRDYEATFLVPVYTRYVYTR